MNSPSVKLFFCGDFCSTPSASRITVSEELKTLIRSADISVCNFEAPVKPENYTLVQDPAFPRLYQSPDAAEFLESLGFDLLSFANNHVFDCGEEGYAETLKNFRRTVLVGSGTFEEAYRVKILECKGIKIGFLALTYAGFGVFDDALFREGKGCAYINHLCVNHLIVDTKKKVDFLIILPHDGIEYIDIPLPETRARYKDFIDYGADIVVGCHPHCPQGWETYKGKPIFYSLGNFFFNSKPTPDFKTPLPYWYNGMSVEIELTSENQEIKFSIHHTLNKDNRYLTLDFSPEIKAHTDQLCRLLEKEELYREALENEIKRHYCSKYIPILEYTFNTLSLKKGIKSFLKTIYREIFKKNRKNFKKWSFIVRSDTERNLMIRGIKKAHNYN